MSTLLTAGTATSGAALSADTSGSLQIQTGSTPTTAITVDTSQNVGINTTSPAYKLDVAGTIRGRSDAYLGFVNGSQAGVWWSQLNYAVPAFQGLTSAGNVGDICMQPGGGNLLVGMTTALGSGINSSSNYWVGTSSSYWKTTNYSATYYFAYNSADKATISGSTGAYTALSDVNKKKDFSPSTLGLEAVMALKPTMFRMIDEAETAPLSLGFIAQDVQSVIPQAYVETPASDGSNFIGLQDRPIIAVLTKAIQDQQALITTLQTQVAALQAKVGA